MLIHHKTLMKMKINHNKLIRNYKAIFYLQKQNKKAKSLKLKNKKSILTSKSFTLLKSKKLKKEALLVE